MSAIDGGTVMAPETIIAAPPPAFPAANCPTVTTNPPLAPPPRVVPVPQAPTTPFTP